MFMYKPEKVKEELVIECDTVSSVSSGHAGEFWHKNYGHLVIPQ